MKKSKKFSSLETNGPDMPVARPPGAADFVSANKPALKDLDTKSRSGPSTVKEGKVKPPMIEQTSFDSSASKGERPSQLWTLANSLAAAGLDVQKSSKETASGFDKSRNGVAGESGLRASTVRNQANTSTGHMSTKSSYEADRTRDPKSSLSHPKLALRPSYGQAGTPISLWMNRTRFALPNDSAFYCYPINVQSSVEMSGKTKASFLKNSLSKRVLDREHLIIVTNRYALLFSNAPLDEHERSFTTESSGNAYTIELSDPNVVSTLELLKALQLEGKISSFNSAAGIVRALREISGAQQLSSTFEVLPFWYGTFPHNHQKHLLPMSPVKPDSALTLVHPPGAVTMNSSRVTCHTSAIGRMLLDVETTSGLILGETPLAELMTRWIDDLLPKQWGTYEFEKLDSWLKGLRVRVTGGKTSNKEHGRVVIGLANTNKPQPAEVTFLVKDGNSPKLAVECSVLVHFETNYPMVIKDPALPVVNVGSKKYPLYLPPEACMVIGSQMMMQNLQNARNETVQQLSRPKHKEKAAAGAIQHEQSTETLGISSCTSKFAVDSSLIAIEARVLDPPTIRYANDREEHPANGIWGRKGTRLQVRPDMAKWALLRITQSTTAGSGIGNMGFSYGENDSDVADIREYARVFRSTLEEIGWKTNESTRRKQIHVSGLEDGHLVRFMQCLASLGVEVLYVSLPKGDEFAYKQVKVLGDNNGIQTFYMKETGNSKLQVAEKNRATLEGWVKHLLSTLALKVNLKLGGTNHTISSEHMGLIKERQTMVVGVESHQATFEAVCARKIPAIISMVANKDKECFQWPSETRLHNEDEVTGPLGQMLTARLQLWQKSGETDLPQNILIYRNGVSESDYDRVLSTELPALEDACKKIYPGCTVPKITLIAVVKKSKLQCYKTHNTNKDEYLTVPAGTVISRGATDPRVWDFFLQSHGTGSGTPHQAHYIILHDRIFTDNSGNSTGTEDAADQVYALTNVLCYVVGHSPQAVSVCAPAYYAHLASKHMRMKLDHVMSPKSKTIALNKEEPKKVHFEDQALEHLQKQVEVHEKLKDQMFYI